MYVFFFLQKLSDFLASEDIDTDELVWIQEHFHIWTSVKVSLSLYEEFATQIVAVWEEFNADYTGVQVRIAYQEKFITVDG